MYVCHAELNAILNSAHNNLKGARVYVTLFPCNECTKAIIQSGIAEVVYYGDKYHDSDSSVAARFMFKKAGVKLTAYQPPDEGRAGAVSFLLTFPMQRTIIES